MNTLQNLKISKGKYKMNNLKLRISTNAYNDLVNLLKFHDEYNCIKLNYNKGCCKSSNIEITLDCKKPNDIVEVIDQLTICYDKELLEIVDEIIIIIKNGNFLVKSNLLQIEKQQKSCSCNCNSGKKNCEGCSK